MLFVAPHTYTLCSQPRPCFPAWCLGANECLRRSCQKLANNRGTNLMHAFITATDTHAASNVRSNKSRGTSYAAPGHIQPSVHTGNGPCAPWCFRPPHVCPARLSVVTKHFPGRFPLFSLSPSLSLALLSRILTGLHSADNAFVLF